MNKKVSPRRICEIYGNRHEGKNCIMEIFNEDISDVLGDLISAEKSVFDRAYVSRRYRISYKKGRLATEDMGQFVTNKISRWSPRNQEWTPVHHLGLVGRELRKMLADPAEIRLLDFLFRTFKKIQGSANSRWRHFPPSSPANRLLFLQAGVGSGKTTLLHHISRIVAPYLNRERGITPVDVYPVIVDLNGFAVNASLPNLWEEVIQDFREKSSEHLDLDTTEGWFIISRHRMLSNDGREIPQIALNKDPNEARRRFVYKCRDHLVYLERLASHIASLERPGMLLLVLDNIDRHPVRSHQLRLIDNFAAMLKKIPLALGIVAVREHTLGTLGHLKNFAGYMQVQRLHLTAPLMSELIQKRIDIMLDDVADGGTELGEIHIGKGVTLSAWDVRQLLRHVNTSFRSTSRTDLDSKDGKERVPTISIERFLPYIFHSNVRGALGFVSSALQSWALELVPVVREFLFLRDHGSPISLPPFSVDELLRLGAVGEYRYYDHTHSSGLFNVFCFRHALPNPDLGRFPLLILYRAIQYFVKFGRCEKNDFLDAMKCFGFTSAEKSRMLHILIDALFLESPDGSDLRKVRILNRTKKLEYYYSTVSVLLTYIENMRNDAVIEYEAPPHEVRSGIHEDMLETAKFVEYVLEQERSEFAYMKKRGSGYLTRYKKIAFDVPVSARMLRSVVHRYKLISGPRVQGELSPREREIRDRYLRLRSEILNASKNASLWPKIRPHVLGDAYAVWQAAAQPRSLPTPACGRDSKLNRP